MAASWARVSVCATADITTALRTTRTVEQAAAEWTSAGRPEHYLWDNTANAVLSSPADWRLFIQFQTSGPLRH
ncbi:MAG: hypothetical protein ACRDQX_09700 [Pseudonocardiaceae bacterium]